MSNYPHSASIATSLSTSPYAVQSNLESLISRSRSHPHPQEPRDSFDAPSGSNAHLYISHSRHPSELITSPRIGTIREASYDDGTAILLGDDDEETGLLGRDSERSRRKSYGAAAVSVPVSQRDGRRWSATGPKGTSRSRSKVRTPPRSEPVLAKMDQGEMGPASASTVEEVADLPSPGKGRGRPTGPRSLSRASSSKSKHDSVSHRRRHSVTNRVADDSSGDEGGDVARGLVASGGGAMFGGRAGLGITPASGGAGMDLDPVDELDARDLELPVAQDGLEVRVWSEALRAEIPLLIRSSLPVFLTQMAEWSLVLASVISIGHLGTTDLAASSLASMTASVSCYSILQGLATALDTLLPAAWASSDPSRVGLWSQRMGVVLAVSMIPMYVLWWNVEGILLHLGQEPAVAARAAQYLRWLSLSIPGYGGNVIVKKYLQAQNLMNIPTYVLFFVSPVNLAMNYLLVWGPDRIRLGFVGGALATSISYTLNFVISLWWVLYYGPREVMHPVRVKHLFSKLGTVTSLGLAGTIMMSSEWWAWEVCALAASLLGPINLAAQSVLLSTASTFFQVPASLGISAAVRCGNLLGAGRGWEAKWASRSSLILAVAFACINSSICLVFRKNWGYLFNSDPEVVRIVASIMPYIALFQIADGVAATAGSILRSLGLHTTGAFVNLTSYYIIGLPFGLWLTFEPRFHLGLIGLWIGLSVALGYASVVEFVLVWRANWTRAVERVRERLGLPAHGEVGENGKWDEGEVTRADD